MASGEVQLKVSLDAAAIRADAARAAAVLKGALGDQRYQLDFEIDSGELGQLDNALKAVAEETARTARQAKILRDAYDLDDREIDKVIQKMNRLEKETDQAKGSASALDNVLQGVGQGLGQALTDIGLEALSQVKVLLGEIASSALEFEGARAAASTLADDVDGLTDSLRQVNGELKGQSTTTGLLKASYDVLSAGYTDTADATTILENATKAAVGGFSDTNTVADATTTILNAYGKSAKDAGAITDVLIETQNKGKITVDQYAQQVGKAVGIVASAGVGFEEFSAAIATATAQGVPAESAVSGTRQAIVNLLKPTAEAKDLLAQFGIENASAALKSGGLVGILETLANQGATSDQLSKIFSDVDGLAVVSTLAGENLGKFQANIEALGSATGVADEQFQKIANSLPGLLTSIQNDFSERVSNIAQSLTPLGEGVLTLLRDTLTEAGEQSGGLDKIAEASERLKTALAENPELAEKLGSALAEVADVAVEQLAQLIDAFTALASNDDATAQLAENIRGVADAVKLAGQAARFLVGLVEGVASLRRQAGELPVVGKALNDVFLTPIPVIKVLVNGVQTVINTVQQALTALGVLAAQAPQALQPALDGTAKVLQSANDALGQAAANIAAPDTSAAQQSAQDLAATQAQAAQDAKAAQEQAAQEAKDAVVAANAEAEAAIVASQQVRTAAIRQQQLDGVLTAEEAAEQIAQIEQDKIGDTIAARQSELEAYRGLLAQGAITREEFAAKEIEVNQAVGDLNIQRLEAEIEAQERAKQAALEKAELENELAQSALDQQSELLGAQEKLGSALATLDQERVKTAIAAAEAAGDTAAAAELGQQLKALELEAEQKQFEVKRQQLDLQLQQNKLEAELALIRARANGASEEEIANLEKQIALVDEIGGLQRQALDAEEAIAAERRQQNDIKDQAKADQAAEAEAQKAVEAAPPAPTPSTPLGAGPTPAEPADDGRGGGFRAAEFRGALVNGQIQEQAATQAAAIRNAPGTAAPIPLTPNPTAQAVGQLANVPSGGAGLGNLQQAIKPVIDEIRALNANIMALAGTPRAINIATESPWEDLQRALTADQAAANRRVNP